MVLHKNRAVMFGGVYDLDLDDDSTESVFFNEMHAFQIDTGRWYPVNMRKVKDKGKDKEKLQQKRKKKKELQQNGGVAEQDTGDEEDVSDTEEATNAASGKGKREQPQDQQNVEEEVTDFKYNEDGREVDWTVELAEKPKEEGEKSTLENDKEAIGASTEGKGPTNGNMPEATQATTASTGQQQPKLSSVSPGTKKATAEGGEEEEKEAQGHVPTHQLFSTDPDNPVPCPRFNAMVAVQRNLMFM